MAILNANDAAQTPRPPLRHTGKPALFMRTVIPKGAVQRSISCSMLSPHALMRKFGMHTSSFQSARQLIVGTDTTLQLYAVDDHTVSLTPLTDVMLFTRIYDIAAVSSPVPGRDVLVVLTDASKISFMQYDEALSSLRCSGAVSVIPPAPFPSEAGIRRQPRLLATHPRKRMVAVASLQSVISVFPVLFLPKHVNAGKVATVAVDGVILSLDFLEDEEGVPGDAILVALLQKRKEQVIALYTVGVPDVGGGLSVTFVGSMITCASHPDDIAVARATSKLTGESMRPTPQAVAVTRLSGCPFLFAVFVRGRIIAGDARSVIVNAHAGESLPTSVRVEHDIMLPAPSQFRLFRDMTSFDDSSTSHGMNLSRSVLPNPTSSAIGFDTQEGFVTPTRTPTNRTLDDPPAVTMPSRRARRGSRDEIPPLPSLSRRLSTSRWPYTDQGDRNLGEDYLSYLFVPAYISLDVGEENGVAVSWVDARDHFSDDSGDGNGLYFVMESGAMFALRWNSTVREGTTTFRIPGGERTRTTPKRNFSVEFIGDVGPAISIASLDRRLLYIANDCADGSLRQLHLPQATRKHQTQSYLSNSVKSRSSRIEELRYGLEIRQEFLNMSPISDFVLRPPQHARIDTKTKLNHRKVKETNSKGPRGAIGTTAQQEWLLTSEKALHDEQSALDHVFNGGEREAEIIACSGIGKYGTIRLIRPGAPVSLLASSDSMFTACNEMWPLRFSRHSNHDAGLILSFAQATVLLLAVPTPKEENNQEERKENRIQLAKLVDGTRNVGLISDRRTIAVNIVEDGVIAQIHDQGVRLISLDEKRDVDLSRYITTDSPARPLYQRVQDWNLPEDGIISMGAIRFGYVLVSVTLRGQINPVLYLLSSSSPRDGNGLQVVSSVRLESEISCMEIPDWDASAHERGNSLQQAPSVFAVGTYAPSVEIRSLDSSLKVLDRKITSPWNLTMLHENVSDRDRYQLKPPNVVTESDTSREMILERKSRITRSIQLRAKSDHMTAVPESLCFTRMDGQRKLLAGLRDGSVMCMSVLVKDDVNEGDTERKSYKTTANLSLDTQRKLGHRPVTLKRMTAAIGPLILGQAERSWMGTASGCGRTEWTPLAFPETLAVCSFSVEGADRCFAAVGRDDSLYICALRRKSAVSVRSIQVGATPRRVLAMPNPQDCIVVATSNALRATLQPYMQRIQGMRDGLTADSNVQASAWRSDIRVYDRRRRKQIGAVALLNGELVHVLVDWLGFILVGTSCGNQEACPQRRFDRGRILMYSLRHASKQAASASNSKPRLKFSLCSEVVLPGAVLAGAAHPSADIFVASCNEEVIVFFVPRSRAALVEIARVSARTLVMSISLKDDIVCIVDRKDSVSFFQLLLNSGRLVRDRSDHRRRIVSHAVQVDRTLAIAVDRLGGLFSIGYEDGDAPTKLPIAWPDGSVISPYLRTSPSPTIPDWISTASGSGEAHVTSVATLGGEFDMMHHDSSSDQTTDSHDENAATACMDANESASLETSEQDQIMTSDDTANSGPLTSGDGGSDESNELAGEQGGVTDEANPAQSADDGIMAAIQEDGNGGGAGGIIGVDSIGTNLDARDTGKLRNLICQHSYNLNDTALRVRAGQFVRHEATLSGDDFGREAGWASTLPYKTFLCSPSHAILCGTLGGAMIGAVPMSAGTYEVLSAVERDMGENMSIIGPALGDSHKRFRSTYGREAVCCVDGDLLKQFCRLDNVTKGEIASMAGCGGDKGVVRIQGMIDELFDRIG